MLGERDARAGFVTRDDVGNLAAILQSRLRGQANDALAARRLLRAKGELEGPAQSAVGLCAQTMSAGLAAQIDCQDAVDAGHPLHAREHRDRIDLLDWNHGKCAILRQPSVKLVLTQGESGYRNTVVQSLVRVGDRPGFD